MPTYVSLINWTEQGIKNFRDTSSRGRGAREYDARVHGVSAAALHTARLEVHLHGVLYELRRWKSSANDDDWLSSPALRQLFVS